MTNQTTIPLKAYLAIIFALTVFAGETVTLRLSAKLGLPTGVIAVTQCTVAALVQLFFGGRFSRVDWRNWWPAIFLSTLTGISFYLACRIAPAALVGLMEPLGLLPLMLGHRFIQGRTLRLGGLLSLLMLVVASCATVGQWPEKIGPLAILISIIGIACCGSSLIAGEVVPKAGIPSFVLAMQTNLALGSAIMAMVLGRSSLAGTNENWQLALLVGIGIGLFVGLAVSALYYGIQYMGALRAGTIKILRLPMIAIFAFLIIGERASLGSSIALGAVVLFAILTVQLSNERLPKLDGFGYSLKEKLR